MDGRQDRPVYVGRIRLAAGGRDLYDKLATDGRVATRGIFFDTNSDVIQPESTPTLREIGEMLNAHADMALIIEGHTDSEGDADYNLELSERRAAAVVRYLVDAYGISADRLAAEGLGESAPVGDNATPEGRQQNRRVELVVQ
jgi:outer membrane protein OmpA-like peptidoglycan-associated protein